MCANIVIIKSLEEFIEIIKETEELFDEALYTVIFCDNNEILSNHTLKTKDEVELIVKTYINGSYLNYPVKITCKYIPRQKIGHLLSRYEFKTKWIIKFENQSN